MGTACRDQPSVPPVQWVDVALEAGVHFTHYNDARGQYHYVETFGSGAAFIDYDGDGYLDLYLVNGAPIDSALSAAAPTNQRTTTEVTVCLKRVRPKPVLEIEATVWA